MNALFFSMSNNFFHINFCRKFLKLNQYYDEQMAVNILGQNHLWPFLSEVASFRGLLPEVLEAQAKMMSHAISECDSNQKQKLLLLITQRMALLIVFSLYERQL